MTQALQVYLDKYLSPQKLASGGGGTREKAVRAGGGTGDFKGVPNW